MRLYLLVFFFVTTAFCDSSITCEQCVNSNKNWCPDQQTCTTGSDCTNVIKRLLNCPRMPDAAYAYTDSFGRGTVLPLTAAIYNTDPGICFRSKLPHVTLERRLVVPCPTQTAANTTCTAYTAYDSKNKIIIAAFAGTNGIAQLEDEILSFFKERVPFYNNGHIFKYFHDAFFDIWNEGMQTDIRNLKYKYPDAGLLVVGQSLGAGVACTFASYMVGMNLWQGPQVKQITTGQPRTGDYQFASWHDQTFPFSYRVVHHHDPVPHVPPSWGPDEVFHHRYEVWYDNNMAEGQPYTICPQADGPGCSNAAKDENILNHLFYFNTDMRAWGLKGCT